MSEGRQRSEEPGSTLPHPGRFIGRMLLAAFFITLFQGKLSPLLYAAEAPSPSSSDGVNGVSAGLILLILFLCHALFAAAETALRSASRTRMASLAEEGNRKAARVLRLIERPVSFLTAIQVVKTTLTLSLPVTAFPLIERLLEKEAALGYDTYAVPITIAALVFLLLLFGEIIPKVLASQHADRVALFSAWWVGLFTAIIYPLFKAIDRLSRLFVSRSNDKSGDRSPVEAEEEIKMMAAGGVETGEIEPEEQEMIRGVLSTTDKVAREVMVPRIDITAVEVESPIHMLLDAILQHGHSRIPVYEENIDRIIGLVHARDLLNILQTKNLDSLKISELPLRSPHFIPEDKRLPDLLAEFRENKHPIAIVVDEYGGTSGIVSIEDILEEIVGEIRDESDVEEEPFHVVDENTIIFAARVAIDEVNEMLHVHLPEDEFDSIGGFVFGQVGRLPAVGQSVRYDGVELIVEDTDGRRIQRVRARKVEEDEEAVPNEETPKV